MPITWDTENHRRLLIVFSKLSKVNYQQAAEEWNEMFRTLWQQTHFAELTCLPSRAASSHNESDNTADVEVEAFHWNDQHQIDWTCGCWFITTFVSGWAFDSGKQQAQEELIIARPQA